jgi:hypothetical protein
MSFVDKLTSKIKYDIEEGLVSTIPSEAIVKSVEKDGRIIFKHVSSPSEMIDTELGSLTGGTHGLFYKPIEGSKILLTRVYPGTTNHTQVLKVINNPVKQGHDSYESPLPDTETGYIHDGNLEIEPGDVLVRSIVNGKLKLSKVGNNGELIELIDSNNSGLYISSSFSETKITEVADFKQNVNAAGRATQGKISNIKNDILTQDLNHEYKVEKEVQHDFDKTLGIYGPTARDFYSQNEARNPALTVTRKVINQINEGSRFIGFEKELELINSKIIDKSYSNIELARYLNARKDDNLFFMTPDQIIQVIAGTAAIDSFDSININYNKTEIKDFKNHRYYISIKNNQNGLLNKVKSSFKRGIAYHFQLNTHDSIMDDFSSLSNTRFIFDKEGVLKANIPKSSKTGNILYVDNTYFMKGSAVTRPAITTGFAKASATEQIPITLRDADGNVVFPKRALQDLNSKKLSTVRKTGIEFLNSNGYFGDSNQDSQRIRINITKHHNMPAACELLTANYIEDVFIPSITSSEIAPHLLIGNMYEKTFERYGQSFKPSITRPGNPAFHSDIMATVRVSPAPPVINPGGLQYISGDKNGNDIPYTNDDQRLNEGSKTYSGVSANINLEGSIEASIGADDADGKSVVLDTQGSVVSWIGKDNQGRSLAVQTDGSVLVNIGGHDSSGRFNSGRFDLRVNLTDKGTLGDNEQSKPPNYRDGDSDFLISVSEKGIIISGMKKEVPMILNNSGKICIQSPAGIDLNGGAGGVTVTEKQLAPRPTYMSPESKNTDSTQNPGELSDIETIQRMLTELATEIESLKSGKQEY